MTFPALPPFFSTHTLPSNSPERERRQMYLQSNRREMRRQKSKISMDGDVKVALGASSVSQREPGEVKPDMDHGGQVTTAILT